jgi:hypothetical protein
MEWVPIGNQTSKFKAEDVLSIHNDILIAKMNPGQVILF